MAKAIWRGLAKPDNPIFREGVYFATPILLKNLEEMEKSEEEKDCEKEEKEKSKSKK